ncbi:DUF6973 domain-containing protein [Psychrobacter lutiphocae]|uniref:DUF6973 domain-containing protein n=1 Tax=Psychrobacter lutiphocae TaxID=540500 RepID=UPI000382B681|nr:hypothetical protein [Psychrobacter lutiphocae]
MDVFAGEAFSKGVKPIDADDFARNLAHKLAAAGVGCIAASAKNQSCDAAANSAGVAVENNSLFLEASFALRHPSIASQIGTVSDDPGSELIPNISTITSTFQINLINNNPNLKNASNLKQEGGIANAFRHVLWQSIITQRFGSSIAIEVGNSHEFKVMEKDINIPSYGGKNLDGFIYRNLSDADEVIDQFNNRIGRYIAINNPNKNNKQYARLVLEYYRNNGLYQAVKIFDGSYVIRKVKLPNNAYNHSITILQDLDHTGAGESIRKRRESLRKPDNPLAP